MHLDQEIMNRYAEINALVADLSSAVSPIGDWKVVKIYEARLQGKEDPYDFEALAAERQAARDRINQLQKEIKDLEEN